tara:strand:- start:2005 stop:2697 length:693 start_codon:yes stop_codon:yes gene_type:complete
MKQEILIMVCRLIILLINLLFFSFNSYCNILYEKKDLIITSIDIDTYKELYESNYGLRIDKNNALKDLVLINNLIKNLEENNKEFLKQVDTELSTFYKENYLNDQNIRNFYRFSIIKNEFIINYFQNNLIVEEIEIIFSKLESLDLPLSKNNCLIIDKVIDLKSNKNFIKSFFNNIKINSNEFTVLINGEKYRVCIDEKRYRSIEQLIVDYIQTVTEKDFEYFVYGKTKN